MLLDGRARHRAVGTEYAAIAGLGAQQGVASRALVEELACRGGHGFGRLVLACRTRERALQLHLSHRSRPPWPWLENRRR